MTDCHHAHDFEIPGHYWMRPTYTDPTTMCAPNGTTRYEDNIPNAAWHPLLDEPYYELHNTIPRHAVRAFTAREIVLLHEHYPPSIDAYNTRYWQAHRYHQEQRRNRHHRPDPTPNDPLSSHADLDMWTQEITVTLRHHLDNLLTNYPDAAPLIHRATVRNFGRHLHPDKLSNVFHDANKNYLLNHPEVDPDSPTVEDHLPWKEATILQITAIFSRLAQLATFHDRTEITHTPGTSSGS